MLAKKSETNQIDLPESVVSRFPGVEYFDVVEEGGRIVLVPLDAAAADEARARLESEGITEGEVREALQWARES